MTPALDTVRRYHDTTKHHFHRFAASLGYLDWATQPDPFRAYAGSPVVALRGAAAPEADLLRYALGLSAWKSFRGARWALRVNPSSGNLHPTEGYLIAGRGTPLAGGPGVYHYAADRHALEQRCVFEAAPDGSIVALTSIHWREAWKYGERAFRYCQHDIGHAIAAVRVSAAVQGRSAALVSGVSDSQVGALCGVDRDDDFAGAEREAPACLLALDGEVDVDAFVAAARAGRWAGRANRLSADHAAWPIIDEVAEATRGRAGPHGPATRVGFLPARAAAPVYPPRLILQRRSAVAFDGRTPTDVDAFTRLLRSALPGAGIPFDALWWSPRIHLLLFVHRVDGLEPGLYLLPREPGAVDRLEAAVERDFLWTTVSSDPPLFLLARGDCRAIAQRLSCDQAIAADGFFSLGMIADFDRSLDEFGAVFYRHLFWEAGVVGQALYLAAEMGGARATGIGCFFDDPVHDLLGLHGHAWQSLYHFTVGTPVEDVRLTTEPGYEWERSAFVDLPRGVR